MKKYIKPQIEVQEIETESFLCASFGDALDKSNTITDQTEILSKDQKYDIWGLGDDDDEY